MTTGTADAKYSLINNYLYQLIGVVHLGEIKKWDEVKNSSHWVNVNFQRHEENRQTKHFSYSFVTKDKGDFYGEANRFSKQRDRIY